MAARRLRIMQLEHFAREIQNRFESSHYWEYEKFLGNGSYGVTVLLRETNRLVVRQKRIALKLAQRRSQGVPQLRNELKWLKRLRGARHIVRMLASCDNLIDYVDDEAKKNQNSGLFTSVVQLFGKLVRLPPREAFGPLAGLMDGPAVALEYLDQGDLLSLKRHVDDDGVTIPNKILWSLFLCLTRACIGMAYPLARQETQGSILETIPNGVLPSGIIHNDVATRNIMIASADDNLDEHNIGHMFKLIDFGSTREYEFPRGAPENLYDIAFAVASMMDPNTITQLPMVWKSEITRLGSIIPSELDPNDDPYPHVDLALRDLIARCSYIEPSKRPSLYDALNAAEKALERAPDTFPDPPEETDDSIREFFQEYIFNRSLNSFR
ncbi:kinase-like protein [Xylaria cf. heliscus]|nr:kinase-like protein [Xylaria cf. heliscus]